MIHSLTTRDARTLLVGFGVVLSILAYARLIPWWTRTLDEERDAAREVHAQVLEATELLRTRHAARESLRRLRGELLQTTASLLTSGSAAGAGVELAGVLSDIAADVNVRLDILQPLGDTLSVGPFVRVSVRTQLSGDVQGVMEMLGALESGPVLLAISSLTLTQSDPTAVDAKPESLRGELVVRALFHR